MAAAAAAATKSIIRSSSLGSASAKFASKPKSSFSSSFRLPKSLATPRILRSPLETSFCVESLLPMHSVTASALMTSLLSVSCGGYSWIADAGNSDA